jgi:hypothetical protein
MRLNLAVALSVYAIGGMLPAQPAAGEPDKTQGVAIMSAVVNSNGTLFSGTGGVSSTRIAAGTYRVAFPRSVEDCTWVASLGNVGGEGNALGTVSASVALVPEELTLFVDGNANFSGNVMLVVFCPR